MYVHPFFLAGPGAGGVFLYFLGIGGPPALFCFLACRLWAEQGVRGQGLKVLVALAATDGSEFFGRHGAILPSRVACCAGSGMHSPRRSREQGRLPRGCASSRRFLLIQHNEYSQQWAFNKPPWVFPWTPGSRGAYVARRCSCRTNAKGIFFCTWKDRCFSASR
jgi:hypothetical protein